MRPRHCTAWKRKSTTGRWPSGRRRKRLPERRQRKKPAEPKPGPEDKDQVNFTDEESRIGASPERRTTLGAVVDNASRLIVGTDLGHTPVDRQAFNRFLRP